jgi:hypothetical protein
MLPAVDGQKSLFGSESDCGKLRDKILQLEETKVYFEPDAWCESRNFTPCWTIDSFLKERYSCIGGNGSMRAHFDPHGDLPSNVRKYLKSRYISLGLLDARTAKILLEKEVWELELFERTWLALEDCLLLSSPEAFLTQKGQIRKYFRYCISMLTYGGFDVLLKPIRLQ